MFVRQTVTAAFVLAALAACEVGVSDGTPTPTPGGSAPVQGATPDGAMAGDCHVGTFQLTAIASKRGVSTQVGEVKVTSAGGFVMTLGADGTWRLAADGSQPLTVQANGLTVQGSAKGEVRGRYARSDNKLGFQQESASGNVTVQAAGQSHSVAMDDFAQALAPSGVTTVTCTATELRLSSENVDMTMTRTGGAPSTSNAAASGVLTITGKGTPVDEDCRGRKVVVESDGSPIRLRGDCPSLEVRGNLNPIEIDRVDEIILTGSGNTITWEAGLTRSEPAVQPGKANNVRRK